MRLLVVEDDPDLNRQLVSALSDAGYAVDTAFDGEEGHFLGDTEPYDAVVLDLGLPKKDGISVLEKWRRDNRKMPVLILTARERWSDKVAGMDAGADDYVAKPFHTGELLARLRVALRHAARVGNERESCFISGELHVDLAARRVFVREAEVHLTPIEYKLLTTLVRNAGKVLTHRYLLQEVWGPGHAQETHYLRVFMANLRRKIEADPAQPRFLLTEQGVGYRLASD